MPALDSHRSTPIRGPQGAHIFGAVFWYAITLAAWAASWSGEPVGESSTASLLVLALLSELISVTVRGKHLSGANAPWQPENTARASAELAWLCAWGGQVNALGMLAMLSPSLASMLPALIVTAVVEAFLLPQAPFAWNPTRRPVAAESVPAAASVAAPSVIELAASENAPAEDEPAEPDDRQWTRSTHDGRSETGQRYLSGWVRYHLEADQKTVSVTIGFSPAFPGTPDIELDQEVDSEDSHGETLNEHCEALVEHVTPAGMRVAIKRTAAGAVVSGKLLWHASESHHPPTLLRTRLP